MPRNRAELDDLCWKIMHERPLPKQPPSQPCNYQHLSDAILRGADFEEAFHWFNRNFANHRLASFFEVPPRRWIDREYQAFLAGVTEFWCIEFDLPMPKWVEDPLYTLRELWEPMFCPMPMDLDSIASRTRRSHPCFINRNVIFEARNLIVI